MDQAMPKVNIRMVIIPDGIDQQVIAGCDETVVGNTFATAKELKLTRVRDGFAILYREGEFNKFSVEFSAKNIADILMGWFPKHNIIFSIYYNFQHIGDPDMWKFDDDTALKVIQFANYYAEHGNPRFNYVNSESIQRTCEILRSRMEDTEGEVAEDENDDGDDFWERFGFVANDDDDDDRPKKKRGKKHYGHSRLMANGKHPKRDYNRHGVLVSRDSDDMKRDRKMIKEFLEDFIPGNARWKRDFRDDLLERWLSAFAIRKKKLRKLEKKMHQKRKASKPNAAQAIAMGIGRQIMTGSDVWNNPNK